GADMSRLCGTLDRAVACRRPVLGGTAQSDDAAHFRCRASGAGVRLAGSGHSRNERAAAAALSRAVAGMSAGGDRAAAARGPILFDVLVSHERGDGIGTASSLRPRLPYLFEDATRDAETDIAVLAMVAAAPATSSRPPATPASPPRGARDTPRQPAL